jgi:hypothetical protein
MIDGPDLEKSRQKELAIRRLSRFNLHTWRRGPTMRVEDG